jgi:membrane-associated phospholipid phosphatase
VATTVGVSRVHHDAHWASDVLAGAALGALAGKAVVAANRKWTLIPARNGVVVSVTW